MSHKLFNYFCQTMMRTQRFLLRLTSAQEEYFRRAVGLRRFAWNWALALSERHYRIFGKRPSSAALQKRWNRVKRRRFSWATDLSKHIPERAFRDLDRAYAAAFARLKAGRRPGFPRFRKKGRSEGFLAGRFENGGQGFRLNWNRVYIPKVGWVRLARRSRWLDLQPKEGRVRFIAGRWWLTLTYDVPPPKPLPVGRPVCGVDLGCTTFATVSSGGAVEEIPPPKPYARTKRRLRLAARRLSRRFRRGKTPSRRYARARLAKAKLEAEVAIIRRQFLHNLTARLVKQYGTVVLEDLSVAGLARGWLAGTVHDLGWGEFRRQIEYKAGAYGTRVVLADRFYPSSKTCSRCGLVKAALPLSERVFRCDGCGLTIGRDHNAAVNLEKLGSGDPK